MPAVIEAGLTEVERALAGWAQARGATRRRGAVAGGQPDRDERPIQAVEAAALGKMADRGRITGGILDGPSALDNAINPEAARIEPIQSPAAGRADRLVVPALEAGDMLAKSLSFLADAAGLGLGARVSITLTSRADTVHSRLAASAMAALMAHRRKTHAAPPV